MPRIYPHSHLCHGHLVGFTVKLFGNEPTYCVFFRTPDGRRVRRDTNQTRLAQAVEAGRLIIEKEFAPATNRLEKVTWDEAIERLKARLATSGNRTSTLDYYLKCIRLLRNLYPNTDHPADLSPAGAARWRDWMMSTPGRRKKLPSAHYVAGLIVGLSSLWEKWFVQDLKICEGNPWQDVAPPKADKLPVKYATDDQIKLFYAWIAERYGHWSFPKLFLSTKAYTGCRLMDLCGLKSAQLSEGQLVFPPDLTKGRKERAVPIPDDLFAELSAFKGETWLWENYLPGLKEAIKAKGWPVHQLNMEFAPQRLYSWVETVFADYRTAHPKQKTLTTHMFRKRAFTLAHQAGVQAHDASIAYGCNVDTMMRHYVSLDEQKVTDDVFARMHGQKKSAEGDKQ